MQCNSNTIFELNQVGVRVSLYIGDIEGSDGGGLQCKRAAGKGSPNKKYGIIWEFFPTWGEGGLPNSQIPKRVHLNHSKITQKTN